jgi:hypothetical protein
MHFVHSEEPCTRAAEKNEVSYRVAEGHCGMRSDDAEEATIPES